MKKLKIALLVASLLASMPALAQDDLTTPDAIALRNQILQLQAEVNALQAQSGGQNGGSALAAPVAPGAAATPAATPSSNLLPSLLTRISSLEDQVRALTGQVQDLTNQLQQQKQTFTKQIGDINFQLQGGTGAAPSTSAPAGTTPDGNAPSNPAPSATPPDSGSAAPPAAPPDNGTGPTSLNQSGFPVGTLGTLPADQTPATPAAAATPAVPSAQDTLQDGISALTKGRYTVAENDAKSVLASDRASPIGYDAQFLLARALAGKRDWEHAAVAYDDTYTRARYGSHSQDAQLGEARALLALGDNGASCGALNRLTRQYAAPRADLVPEITKLHARACGA